MLATAVLLMGALAAAAAPARDFAFVDRLDTAAAVIVDTRPAAQCGPRTLAGARCLAAEDLLGPQRRLPNARDLLWLLGTAGLTGAETVQVVGDDPQARDFVAGVLFVAGQRQVQVVTVPVKRLLAGGHDAGPGVERAFTRSAVFVAPMRDERLILREELRALLARGDTPLLLDGRSTEEYWGERARAARTGHLPGAISLPATTLRAQQVEAAARTVLPPVDAARPPVAYAHDPLEGFAYFTLLAAGHGLAVRLYAEGWSEWAADGSLPADAVGYPEPARAAASERVSGGIEWRSAAGGALAGAALMAAAFVLGAPRARSRRGQGA